MYNSQAAKFIRDAKKSKVLVSQWFEVLTKK